MPNRLLDCFRRLARGGQSDGQLLALFVQHGDEDAFTALLNRHSPMVMGVCRRILRNQQDAEDAYQAAFLILARKAGSIQTQDSIGGWLYRVAYRTALEARARILRRRSKEQQANGAQDPAAQPDERRADLLALLDQEIDRLPDKYRVPVVLCELEGRSRKEVADLLGIPEGTLSWRLAHARKMLAQKFARRGLAVSELTLAVVVAPAATSASLRAATVKAVLSVGAVRSEVLSVSEGVMKAMFLSKLKITVCVTVLALLAGVGAMGVAYRLVAQEMKQAVSASNALGPSATDDHEAPRKSPSATHERAQTPDSQEQPARERPKIVVGSPKVKDVLITQPYVCQINAHRHIRIRVLENGFLQEVAIKEGQTVKKGDVMFKILPTRNKARYEAELAEARPVEQELENTKKLFERENLSLDELARLTAQLAVAQTKAKLVEARLNLYLTPLRAPFDGILDRLQEQGGSLIKEGGILTTLTDNSVMWVYFNVPERDYLDYMAARGKKKEEPRVELVLANGTKFKGSGKIAAIEAQFNPQTGNIPFRADFPNPDGLLRHGQSGKVLMHRKLDNAIVIPQRASFEILDKRYVYVVGKDGVAHRRPITVEHELDDIFVIKSGLDEKDKIVVEGVRQVHEGDKVEYELREP